MSAFVYAAKLVRKTFEATSEPQQDEDAERNADVPSFVLRGFEKICSPGKGKAVSERITVGGLMKLGTVGGGQLATHSP